MGTVFGGNGDPECFVNTLQIGGTPIGWLILPSDLVNLSVFNSDMYRAVPQHETGCLTQITSSEYYLNPICDSDNDGELDIIFYTPEYFVNLTSINDPVPSDTPALGCTYLGTNNGIPILLSAYNIQGDCYVGNNAQYSGMLNNNNNNNNQGGR